MAQRVFDPHADLPPRIGKYIPVGELGRGGMGVVFLAEDDLLKRRVALKLLHPAFANDGAFRRRFSSEASLVSQLNHPHIVRIHSLESTELGLAIDMEHLEGGCLADILARQGTTAPQVLRIVEQALEALTVCHDAGLVHRDIKPSNILFDAHGNLRLSDFGLAKAADATLLHEVDVTRSSTMFMGTPRYAPPEAWEGQEPTPAWDLYSLGVVMYESFAGRPPYQATSPLGLLREMAAGPPPGLKTLCPDLSPGMLALGEGLYASEASKRFVSAAEALAHLRALPEYARSGREAAVRTPTIRKRPRPRPLADTSRRPWSNARRLAAGAAIAAIAVGVAAAGFVAIYRPSLDAPTAATDPPARPVFSPRIQEQAGLAPTLTMDGLTALTKSPADSYRVYRAIDLETGSILVHPALAFQNDAGERQIVMLTGAGIRSFAWPGMDNGAVHGGWAAYYGAYGTVPKLGEIRGYVRSDAPGELYCALTLIDDTNGGVVEERIGLEAVEATDTSVLLAIEGHNLAQTLLYNELLPRRIPWALGVEAQLPALAHARGIPVRVAEGAIVVDGRLEGSAWNVSPIPGENAPIVLPGRTQSGGAVMYVAESDRALYIGLHLEQVPNEDVVIQIGVMGPLSVPLADSRKWFVLSESSGLTTSFGMRGQERYDGTDDAWSVSVKRNGATLEAEVRFAIDALADHELPATWPAWRCNAVVTSRLTGEDSPPLAVWGAPELFDLHHGLLIRR